MSITLVRKSQIRPLNITRSDINTTTSGSALITKIIAGTGLTLSSSTGVNPGTGDVTVALSIATASTLGGVKIGSGLSVAVDGTISVNSVTTTWGSITGLLSNQTDLQAALNAKYNNPTGTSSQYIDGTGAYQTFPSALATGFVRHEVKAGVAINKGQAVYVTTSDGTNMIVGLASNASEATSSKTMGLLDATVSINGFANVVTEGLLAGLNTVGANPGDPVWLGTGGNLIYGLSNKPYAPKHLVFIGIVTRVNANNGEIFVKVQNGFELDEIHNVDLKSTLPINGHLLGYDGTLWVNKTIAGWLGYTPQDAATAITTSNIGSQSVNYANSAGSATVAGYVNNQSGQLFSYDNRVIAPADTTEGYLQFGFTSWRNDGGSPYADYLHMRSYTDSSGGTDNLIMFLKSGIGMRIWQQSWGSNSPYAEYVDVWTTGNFTQTNVNNWNSAYSWGNHSSQGYATQLYVNTAIANLVDAAPDWLNTLNELAAALGDDPNFATTVTNNIAGKVSKSGDTMTGNLNWAQTDRGLTWGMNTDGAYIKFFNAGDGDSDSRLEYATSDNGDEYHRWVIAGTERMNLRTEGLNVNGVIYSSGYGNSTEWYAAYTWGNHAGLYASISHTHTFASITSKPTTIAGYGITNAYTDAQIQNFFNGANAITGYNKSNWDTAYSWGNHASAGYRVNSINNTAYVYATSYRTENYDFTLDPRLSIDSMSIKLWDNYFNNSGLGSDYGSLLDIYGRGGHVHSQFYMDADNTLHYRSASYAGGWRPWHQIWTTGTLTNLNQLINGPGYITGYTETDTLQSVTSRGFSTNTNIWIRRPANKVDNASCTELPSRVEFNNSFAAGASGYTVFHYPTPSVFRIYADYDGNIGGVQPDIHLGLGYLTIKSSGGTIGNVGVGTANALYKLDIAGAVRLTGSLVFDDVTSNLIQHRAGTDVNTLVTVGHGGFDHNGYLRIGGANVATQSWVTSQGYINGYTETDTLQSVTSRGSSTNTDISIGGTGGDRGLAIYHGDYGRIRFYQGSSNLSTIHSFSTSWSGGDVFTSGGALNITGNTGVTIGGWNAPDVVFRAGGINYFRNSVGIGTTTPQVSLDVNGHIGVVGSNHIYFGHTTTNIGAWTTRIYASGSTQKFNAQTFIFNNEGYGSVEFMAVTANGINLRAKNTIDSSDSWLRLNQAGDYGSGVYTPYVLRNDGVFYNYGGIEGYNTIRGRKAQTAGNYTTAALWTESYDNTATGIAFHISGNYGGFLEMRTDRVLYWADNPVITSGNIGSYAAAINHTHDLGRYSLSAPQNVDGLTSSNFRSTLFGLTSNTWNISTARWNSVPSGLSGMNMYGTMFAWSGSDTHGFIATDYSTANIQVGGGNGNSITWRATLIHSSNIGSYALTSYTETDTLNSVTTRGAATGNAIEVGGLTVITRDVDVITYQGRFQVYNGSGTGNLGYRVQTDEQGGWRWQFVDGGNNEYFGVDYPSGNVTVRGAITEQSSLRYKENIINLESITEKVDKLRPVRYNKIGNTNTEIGLIAEEVAEVFPEFVNYNADGEVESLNYTRLSVVLLQTVKELSDKINKLETK